VIWSTNIKNEIYKSLELFVKLYPYLRKCNELSSKPQ